MSERLVIVNADDLGYDPSIDEGILEAVRAGTVSSTTLMVNTPWSASSAAGARACGGLGVGLHFNLARGVCLSGSAALVGGDGGLVESRAGSAPVAAVAAELRAQLDRFAQLMGRPPTHLDVHKHLHRNPSVLEAVIAVSSKLALPVRSIDPAMRHRLARAGLPTNDAFVGETGPQAWWTPERYLMALDEAPEGLTELMCHPGKAPSRVETSYAAQRLDELSALLDGRVLARLRAGSPRLVTWAAATPSSRRH